jgi:hypothetical protein
MPGESLVQVTSGAGPKLHTWQRTVGANNVEDEVVLTGEHHLATYIAAAGSLSIATAAAHVMQLMAGASLNVYVRRISVFQYVAATTAALAPLSLVRLTTAGTGGTSVTPAALDTSDAASGAAAMTLPTVKGTEGVQVGVHTAALIQTVPVGGGSALLTEWNFDSLRRKGLRIPAGAANGIALKNVAAQAGASVVVEIEFTEAGY